MHGANQTPRTGLDLRHWLNRLAPVLALAVFGLAIISIYHLIHEVRLEEIRRAMFTTSWRQVFFALGFTVLGYCVLVGYDFMALRHVERKAPPGTVVLTSFMAYSIGNTVGLSVLSGGAVRYRMYSRYGLDAADIAVVGLFCAASFGFGEVLAALAALGLSPDRYLADLPVSAHFMQWSAIIVLGILLVLAYWMSARRKGISLGGSSFVMPRPGTLSIQILLAIADLGLASAVLFVLLPEAARPEFFVFFGWFVIAMAVAVMSHVPGGAGVFEAVIGIGLAGLVPLPELAGALLFYRLVYFVLPFIAGLLLFGGTGLRTAGPNTTESAWRRWSAGAAGNVLSAAPYVLSWVVLLAGAVMVLSALLPAHYLGGDALRARVPMHVIEFGSISFSALGMALVVISFALAQRVRAALVLTMVMLAIAAMIAWFVLQNASMTVLFALAFAFAGSVRGGFSRVSTLSRNVVSTRLLSIMGAVFVAGLFVMLFSQKSLDFASTPWLDFTAGAHASRALRAGGVALATGLVGLLYLLLRPASLPLRLQPPGPERLQEMVQTGKNANGGLVYSGDKQVMMSSDGNSFLMFANYGRSMIALDDPVGAAGAEEELVADLVRLAEQSNRRPVFYEIGPSTLPAILNAGMRPYKVGEEAIVSLPDFSLQGGDWRKLRTQYNRAKRDGLEFHISTPPHDASLIGELKAISDAWLKAKKGREKRFSLGRFDAAYLQHFPLAVATFQGKPVAFANLMTAGKDSPVTIDLMRHSEDAPRPTMDFMFLELMLHLQASGYSALSLGLAPLSGMETMRRKRLWEHTAHMVYTHGSRFYGFKGLREFKKKFKPQWVPRYIATFSSMDFAAGLADVTALINLPPENDGK